MGINRKSLGFNSAETYLTIPSNRVLEKNGFKIKVESEQIILDLNICYLHDPIGFFRFNF